MLAEIQKIFLDVKENKITKDAAMEQIRKLKGLPQPEPGGHTVFTRSFTHNEPYLKAHVVFGEQILLGVTHCSLAIEAARTAPVVYPGQENPIIHIHKFLFHRPVVVYPGEKVEVSINIQEKSGRKFFRGLYRKTAEVNPVYHETTSGEYIESSGFQPERENIIEFQRHLEKTMPPEKIARNPMSMRSPVLQTVQKACRIGDDMVGEMEVTGIVKNSSGDYAVHPALLDGGFIIGTAGLPDAVLCPGDDNGMWVPFMIKDIYARGELSGRCFCRGKVLKVDANILVMDFSIYDESGDIHLAVKEFTFKYAGRKEFLSGENKETAHHPVNDNNTVNDGKTLQDQIEHYLAGHLRRILGGELKKEHYKNKNFMELGVDSGSLIMISDEISKELNIELYPTLFFEYQNINDLANYFISGHGQAFSRYFSLKENQKGDRHHQHPEPTHQSTKSFDQTFSKGGWQPQPIRPPAERRPPEAEKINEKDIAVIGMAGRFPESRDLDEFWKNLNSGKDLMKEIPPDHWDWRPWFSEDRDAPNKTYCKWGSFIEVDKFDPVFFGIPPRQAAWMDPQLRILLEVIHAVVEDAGYGKRIRGTDTGVYVGVCLHEYWDEIVRARIPLVDYQGSNCYLGTLPGVVSYTFDLQGASIPVDNACASSLTALHLACKALRSGECGMAFVAGVNLLLSPLHYVNFSRAQALSPTGRCHTFDKAADGYTPGEGVGALLLKPLHAAVRDRDNIHAVIKGTALNHVGKSNNPTSPRPELQVKVLLKAWADAGIDPQTLSYIEAHGTGTILGDPIEINALKEAFGHFTSKRGFCALGSAKSHIGHLEGAAGMAGVIKTILAMKNKQIPVMPGFKELNPYIQLDDSPFYIDTKPRLWEPEGGIPLRAGVSSFGMSGGNTHVVLESYNPKPGPVDPLPVVSPRPGIFVLSALNEERLRAYAAVMVDFLGKKEIQPADLFYTLQVGRQAMKERLAVVASSIHELVEKLNRFLKEKPGTAIDRLFQGTAGDDGTLYVPLSEELRNPVKPARLWVLGNEIDWDAWHRLNGDMPKLISLPVYPFEKKRCWGPQENAPAGSVIDTKAVSPRDHSYSGYSGYGESIPSCIDEVVSQVKDPAGGGIRLDSSLDKESERKIEKFLHCLLLKTFQGMGVFQKPGECWDKQRLREKLGILTGYYRMLDALLVILEKAGFIQVHGKELQTADGLEAEEIRDILANIEKEKERLAGEIPVAIPLLNLAYACVTGYPGVLTGRCTYVEVMFPGGSLELVEKIYKGNELTDFYNCLAARAVKAYIKLRLAHNPGDRIRVLEVGAGTGGTSTFVLGAIGEYAANIHYIYSDVSVKFMQHGKKEYAGQFPFVGFTLLDIEKDPGGQGLEYGSIDLIFASNVFHATRGIANTLAQARKLLRTNGLLIINEGTRLQDSSTLIFGITDGWWLSEDEENRITGSPLLSREKWRQLLESAGFEKVKVLNHVTAVEDEPYQSLILCENSAQSIVDGPAAEIDNKKYIVDKIIGMAAASLGISENEIDRDKTFSEYGVDSLIAVEMVNKINREFGVEIKAVTFFDYPNIDELSNFIQGKWRGKVLNKSFCGVEGRFLQKEPLVAVIGMSGRFPGACDLDEFWKNLAAGKSGICEVPKERWDVSQYYEAATQDPRSPGKTYAKWGGFLEGIDLFDPLFFNISGKEAEVTDPQHRILLEESWKALEDAGYANNIVSKGKCGVFVGVAEGDYIKKMSDNTTLDLYSWTGNLPSVASARLSYFLNLKGPAVAVDTACSSSLVAIHLARQSILDGDCDMAIAGGVFLMITHYFYIMGSNAGMLSPVGKCKSFDDSADGFVPGEGVGMIVLKSLEAALTDGDHIYGIIRGAGVNQDGRTNGITAPNSLSQTALECEVYDKYHIDPVTINYIEAHGTGTRLGDPIEIEALINAFNKYTTEKQFCAVGSVKSNIGHLVTAAGVAGVIKVLLSLEHKQIPPSLHFKTPNQHIDFGNSQFFVNTDLKEWRPVGNSPRRAAVSSFGFSGTNAHMVIEEAPLPAPRAVPMQRPYYLVALSAKNPDALKQKLADFYNYLQNSTREEIALADISFTLLVGRSHFNHRCAVVVKDLSGLKKTLQIIMTDGDAPLAFKNAVKSQNYRDAAVEKHGNHLIRAIADSPANNEDEYRETLISLANLYSQGCELEWEALFKNGKFHRIPLPTYPFIRERYWIAEPSERPKPPVREAGKDVQEKEPGGSRQTPKKAALEDGESIPNRIRRDLIAFIGSILKIKEKNIDPDGMMFDYGFDSISFMDFINKINAQYGIQFDTASFFDLGSPTVGVLAECLYSTFKETFADYFQGSSVPGNTGEPGGVIPGGANAAAGAGPARVIKPPVKKKIPPHFEDDILKIISSALIITAEGYDRASLEDFTGKINREFDLGITPELFISQPSPGAFIDYLKKNFKEKIINHYN